jgi:transposase
MDSGQCSNRSCLSALLGGSGVLESTTAAFTAILFVLLTGLPWRLVPDEIGWSGVTAWRRLRDWQAAGAWAQLHRELLRRLNATGQLDWSVGVVDGSHIRALRGGSLTGPSPVDRARSGSKHHLIVDLHGLPPGVELTGGIATT